MVALRAAPSRNLCSTTRTYAKLVQSRVPALKNTEGYQNATAEDQNKALVAEDEKCCAISKLKADYCQLYHNALGDERCNDNG